MLVLGLDIETTGLNPDADSIIEIGAVLWDTDRQIPLSMIGALTVEVAKPLDLKIPTAIQELTGIQPADLTNHGMPLDELIAIVSVMANQCSYYVAHFGIEFDRKFLMKRLGIAHLLVSGRPWLDTSIDIPYAERISTRSLKYLAAEHGFLPLGEHRAVYDVLTMLRILGHYDLAGIVPQAHYPVVEVVAQVSYEDRQSARSAGFHWDQNRRKWIRVLRRVPGMRSFPFRTETNVLYNPL